MDNKLSIVWRDAIWTFNDICVWSIISASLIFFKGLSGVWLFDIQLRLIINVTVCCMIFKWNLYLGKFCNFL